jgi:hypothetical protein
MKLYNIAIHFVKTEPYITLMDPLLISDHYFPETPIQS